MSDGKLRNLDVLRLLDDYGRLYLDELLKIVQRYCDKNNMDSAGIRDLVMKVWDGTGYRKFETDIIGIKGVLDKMVDKRATVIFADMREAQPLADENILKEQAYSEASKDIMGVYQQVPAIRTGR